jgi:hypothetical protein
LRVQKLLLRDEFSDKIARKFRVFEILVKFKPKAKHEHSFSIMQLHQTLILRLNSLEFL